MYSQNTTASSYLLSLLALTVLPMALAGQRGQIPLYIKNNINQLSSSQTSNPLKNQFGNNHQLVQNAIEPTNDLLCKHASQVHAKIELLTDKFPSDTSWEFWDRSRNVTLMRASNSKYSSMEFDVREVCLDQGEYEYILYDFFADGLCCNHGRGHYKISFQKDDGTWQLVVAGSQFETTEMHHMFHVKNGTLNLVCKPPQRKITLEILTDNYGNDTSWEFRHFDGQIIARNEHAYNSFETDTRDFCIDDSSLYELTIRDAFGDGMCCHYGAGHYKILTEKETILHGGFFQSDETTHLINTTAPILSDRDNLWLNAHNIRREKWHAHYEKEYVPLLWSEALKAEAQLWADHLLGSCGKGMYHDPLRIFGENAAGNSGAGTWADQRTPEQILTRFVERELDDDWPKNSHLTQSIWRASKYVGCAESHKQIDNEGHECHTQVCRYARTGNCNMASFEKRDGTIDWLKAMLEDVNFCSPPCPTDGCRA